MFIIVKKNMLAKNQFITKKVYENIMKIFLLR